MSKKNRLFSWAELGAKHIGSVQSLLATCRLQDINPQQSRVSRTTWMRSAVRSGARVFFISSASLRDVQ